MKYFIGLLIFLLVFFAGKTLFLDSTSKPNEKTAAIELFGNDCCVKKTEYGKDEFEILETHEFVLADKQYISYFFAAKSYRENGNVIDCHVCGSKVAVITYASNGSKWSLVDKNLELTEIGTWGKPPDLAFRSLRLSDKVFGLLIPHHFMSMGTTNTFEYLLSFDGKAWSSSGTFITASENSGGCGEDSGILCYGWTGDVGVLRNIKQNYPDIVIKRFGTDYAENAGEVSFVEDDIYRFDGKSYKLKFVK